MDEYDLHIERLTKDPSLIQEDWGKCRGLFKLAGSPRDDRYLRYGCLTMIRRSTNYCAPTSELTEAIRADTRIPSNHADITLAHLPVFAEWQRRIDALGVR